MLERSNHVLMPTLTSAYKRKKPLFWLDNKTRPAYFLLILTAKDLPAFQFGLKADIKSLKVI